MKTPMQELIEFAEGLWATNPNPRTYYSSIVGKASALLEKEKEVMSQVYADGGDWDEVPQPRFENYYNTTFKTK